MRKNNSLNYMEQCFIKTKNDYPPEGPGAEIELNKEFILLLKNVPKLMDNNAVKAMLSVYGEVKLITQKNARYGEKPFRFAECKNKASMESILRGMYKNEWNIKVSQKLEKESNENTHSCNDDCGHEDANFKVKTKSVINIVHPDLNFLKSKDYENKSNYREYFINKRTIDHIYNWGRKTQSAPLKPLKGNVIKFENQIFTNKVNKCIVCCKISTKYCDNCKDCYCSIDCQDEDWIKHKYVCFKKSASVSVKSKNLIDLTTPKSSTHNLLLPQASFPKSEHDVVITHVEKSNLVFFRSNEPSERNEFIRTLNLIAATSENSENLTELPAPGTFIITKYNNEWYRGIALNAINENKILIAFIDFGNTEIKKLSELRLLQPSMKSMKHFTCCAYLKNVKDVILNINARELMLRLVDESIALKIIYNTNEKSIYNNIQIVSLIYRETKESLNETINELILLRPPIPKESPILFEENSMPVKKFTHGNNVKLFVLDNSMIEHGFVTCIQNEDGGELEKINKLVNEYARITSTPYTPRVGEMCIAKTCDIPEVWYRGTCLMVSGTGEPELLLIDYGDVCTIPYENIRKYSRELLIPCFTNACFIQGLQKSAELRLIDEAAKSKLQKIIAQYNVLTVPTVKVVDQENFINLPEKLVAKIRNKRILQFNENE